MNFHLGGFGAFNGPPQNNHNNNQQFGRPSNPMGMGNSGFGMNPMQQNQPYGGMKRPPNQMNDGNNISKRSRPDTGSWGAMGGDGIDNSNNGPQQTNAGGNWYQDQGYNNSQQQSSYSWN